jgi:hypothetical protein
VRDLDLDFLGAEFTGIEAEWLQWSFGGGRSVGVEVNHNDEWVFVAWFVDDRK